ncbi:MAG TPA: cytochrome c biogenesis protein ResB [Anaeromyxobacter sp.]|nr:cytochrome c biogenesis protein ResB [Anaeromyxobacter sp.]
MKTASARAAPAAPTPVIRALRLRDRLAPLWDALTSLKLTIACLGALMVLVVACTLAQVHLGTFGAVKAYMRSWLVWWDIPGTVLSIPVFPGGALAGSVLAVNLLAAQLRRLELSFKKAGLWVVHAGLILLVVGEFVTGMFQRDNRLAFENGETTNYVFSPREVELAVIDTTDPGMDEVYSIPQSLLSRETEVQVPGTPVSIRVHRFFENAQVGPGGDGPAGAAEAGVGARAVVRELAPSTNDDVPNTSAAIVEPVAGGRSYRTWLVSTALGAPQSFVHEGRTYVLAMRERREYLPYALTLKKFSHDVYPGTDIPKNFSSLVHLENPRTHEARDVLIYMNQPLRYGGKTFYQASFGKNDTLSILQVVENPGWLLPYISCVLVTVGLLLHFGISLSRWVGSRSSPGAPRGAVEA